MLSVLYYEINTTFISICDCKVGLENEDYTMYNLTDWKTLLVKTLNSKEIKEELKDCYMRKQIYFCGKICFYKMHFLINLWMN